MRKLFIAATVVAMTMLSVSSFAATNDSDPNQKKPKDYPSEEMIKDLNLTDQQVSDLKAGEANIREQMKQMREEEMKGRFEKTDKMKENRLALIKKVLNKDQYIKFLEDEYVKANPHMMMPMRGPFGGGPGRFDGGGFDGGQDGPQD